MAGLVDPATAELQLWASTSFVDGRTDCAMSVLAYVERVRGRRLEPRPHYLGPVSGQRFLRRRGGFPRYAKWAMDKLGCPPIAVPERGDVALCWVPDSGDTASLCLGEGMFAVRLAHGLMIAPLWQKMAWAVRGEACPRR